MYEHIYMYIQTHMQTFCPTCPFLRFLENSQNELISSCQYLLVLLLNTLCKRKHTKPFFQYINIDT